MIKPLALLRQCKHVSARITDGAEHPVVLGRERVGREPLGEMLGGEDHLVLRNKGCRPETQTLTKKVATANGQERMAYVREPGPREWSCVSRSRLRSTRC